MRLKVTTSKELLLNLHLPQDRCCCPNIVTSLLSVYLAVPHTRTHFFTIMMRFCYTLHLTYPACGSRELVNQPINKSDPEQVGCTCLLVASLPLKLVAELCRTHSLIWSNRMNLGEIREHEKFILFLYKDSSELKSFSQGFLDAQGQSWEWSLACLSKPKVFALPAWRLLV